MWSSTQSIESRKTARESSFPFFCCWYWLNVECWMNMTYKYDRLSNSEDEHIFFFFSVFNNFSAVWVCDWERLCVSSSSSSINQDVNLIDWNDRRRCRSWMSRNAYDRPRIQLDLYSFDLTHITHNIHAQLTHTHAFIYYRIEYECENLYIFFFSLVELIFRTSRWIL